jgi:HEAT repeat protein
LIHAPGRPPTVTPEEVLQHFGADDGKALGLQLLRQAVQDRDRDDVEFALIVCYKFGFEADHLDLLLQLADADWHRRHEDVVTALGNLKDPRAVDALYRATQSAPEYLIDDGAELARKATWALGKIPGTEADSALSRLTESSEEQIRKTAIKQIEKRSHV